jgi:hypothetical protein
MNNYLQKAGLEILDKDMSVLRVLDGREYDTEERLQLLEQVGNFSITPASLLRRVMRHMGIKPQSSSKKKTFTQKIKKYFDNESEGFEKEIII